MLCPRLLLRPPLLPLALHLLCLLLPSAATAEPLLGATLRHVGPSLPHCAMAADFRLFFVFRFLEELRAREGGIRDTTEIATTVVRAASLALLQRCADSAADRVVIVLLTLLP